MKIIANDIKKINYKNIKMVSLERIAEKSDIISIHVHLNSSTENLINQNFFNSMKKTSFIINTARGKIINETDLLYSLKNKIIAGAGLDVIDGEWLCEQKRSNHKLIKYAKNNSNLLITPHVGGSTKESIQSARIFMGRKVARFLSAL